jgi:hypothetical protein
MILVQKKDIDKWTTYDIAHLSSALADLIPISPYMTCLPREVPGLYLCGTA